MPAWVWPRSSKVHFNCLTLHVLRWRLSCFPHCLRCWWTRMTVSLRRYDVPKTSTKILLSGARGNRSRKGLDANCMRIVYHPSHNGIWTSAWCNEWLTMGHQWWCNTWLHTWGNTWLITWLWQHAWGITRNDTSTFAWGNTCFRSGHHWWCNTWMLDTENVWNATLTCAWIWILCCVPDRTEMTILLHQRLFLITYLVTKLFCCFIYEFRFIKCMWIYCNFVGTFF